MVCARFALAVSHLNQGQIELGTRLMRETNRSLSILEASNFSSEPMYPMRTLGLFAVLNRAIASSPQFRMPKRNTDNLKA